MLSSPLSRALALAGALLATAACPDPAKRPLGATCTTDSECEAGLCIAQLCLDPEGDEDLDSLVNRIEGALGSNPLLADSDGDGASDADEIGVDLANPGDADRDGHLDVIESSNRDDDGDCIADQFDPDDATPEVDPTALARFVCPTVGACGASGSVVTASCAAGEASCDFTAVIAYEPDEIACDGADNDCDGQTDEPYRGAGVTYGGGPFPADAGKALGASCGVGACGGGTVVCAADRASLTCSTANRAGPLACDSDMDCDGVADETEVQNPITEPLAGCSDFYSDADNDGYGAGSARCLCSPFGAYIVDNRDDCAEADPLRYPMAAGICGVDADCDGRSEDVGEPCDDGNSDVADGCHGCAVVARRIATRGVSPSAIAAVGLAGGGFALAWDDGTAPDGELQLGRALAIFDPAGRELARYEGEDRDQRAYDARTRLAALPGGALLAGRWRAEPGLPWEFLVRRFEADGAESGVATPVLTANEAATATQLLALRDRAAIVSLQPLSADLSGIVVRFIGPDGVVTEGKGRELPRTSYTLDAVALDDGTIAVVWAESEPQTFETLRFTQRLDADGAPIGEPRALALDGVELRTTALAPRDGGWALFFIADRGDGTSPVGYQAMSADGPIGNVVYLQQDDADGCPYEVTGGFDAAGYAWAAVSDGECHSLVRGWFAGATTRLLVPFDLALHPGASTFGLAGARSGAGFVLAFGVGDAARPGLYVQRYGADARPMYLP